MAGQGSCAKASIEMRQIMQAPAAVAERAALLGDVRAAGMPSALGGALQRVEATLDAAGCMSPEWHQRWAVHWKQEIAVCSHLQDCLLYTAALQVHSAIMTQADMSQTSRTYEGYHQLEGGGRGH